MKNSFETNFISRTVEKTPFVDMPAQNFFTEWCKINDSIIPEFISREEWEKRGYQGILEKNDQGKQSLFLPTDLHLWEMIDVIKTIDHDTLARNPKKREERASQIKELGVIFEKAGIYLSEYLSVLEEDNGKPIAQDIAREFYQYGLSLQDKKQRIADIPEESSLTQEDKTKLDKWFLGRDTYQKRLAKIGENPSEYRKEDTRKKLLQIYFKALKREGYKASGEKPWETRVGPMQHLQDITRKQITKAIETPEREMKTSIFRRGVEKLVTEMKEVGWRKAINNLLKKVGFDQLLEQKKLCDTLNIDKLKQELEEMRKKGDIAQISARELEIAKKIQKAVSGFPYKSTDGGSGSDHPSKMVETQFINCVGSSILGGGLLDEARIKYLHADLPGHSATVLITSDGKVRWQELTPGVTLWNYKEIQDKDISGKNKNGQPLTVADIVAFSNNPSDGGIRFEINRWWYNLNMGKIKIPNRYIVLFNPEVGLQYHILNNTGNALSDLGREEEAIEAYKQATSFDSKFSDSYNGLGNALSDLGREEEAIEAYKQAISVDPKYPYYYNGLGNALSALGRKEEAIEAYKKAISVDPKYSDPYHGLGNALSALGRKEEAIEAYQKFIKIWDGDEYWTNRAKREIEKLEQK